MLTKEIEQILENATAKSCSHYIDLFKEKALSADGEEKIYFQLLQDITFLIIDLQNPSNPFQPFAKLAGYQYDVLGYFNEEKLQQLKILLEKVNDPDLRARIADLLQLKDEDKLLYAGIAVDSYLESASFLMTYESESILRIQRAFQIAKKFFKSNPLLNEKIILFIKNKIEDFQKEKKFYSAIIWIKILVLSNSLKTDEIINYGEKCCSLTKNLEEIENYRAAEEGWKVTALCFASQQKTQAEHLEKLTKVYEKLIQSSNSLMNKLIYTRSAIELYRKLGSKKHKKEIDVLENDLTLLQEKVFLPSMQKVSVKQDITLCVKILSKEMGTRNIKEKIKILSNLFEFLDPDKTLSFAKSILSHSILPTIQIEMFDGNWKLQATSLSEKVSGLSIDEAQIIKWLLQPSRAALIEKAREIIMQEHSATLDEIEKIVCQESSWIPDRNRIQLTRGIKAGFSGDWMQCLLFLAPLFQTMLSSFLASKNISTVKHHQEKVQDTASLEEMLNNCVQFLEPSLVFELKFLLIDRAGYKLRHSGAHGEISDEEFSSDGVKIFWWIIVKILSGNS